MKKILNSLTNFFKSDNKKQKLASKSNIRNIASKQTDDGSNYNFESKQQKISKSEKNDIQPVNKQNSQLNETSQTKEKIANLNQEDIDKAKERKRLLAIKRREEERLEEERKRLLAEQQTKEKEAEKKRLLAEEQTKEKEAEKTRFADQEKSNDKKGGIGQKIIGERKEKRSMREKYSAPGTNRNTVSDHLAKKQDNSVKDLVNKIKTDKKSSPNLSHTKKLQINMDNLYCVRGKCQDKDAWHYVLLYPNKVQAFIKAVQQKQLNIDDYGVRVAAGWGKDPPEAIAEKMQRGEFDLPDSYFDNSST